MKANATWVVVLAGALFGGLCMAQDCTEASELLDGGLDGSADATSSGNTERERYATADCQLRGACIVQNGAAFSQSECETANRNEGERSDSRGCTEVYDAYLACAAGITYDCSQNLSMQMATACNSPYQTLAVCLSR